MRVCVLTLFVLYSRDSGFIPAGVTGRPGHVFLMPPTFFVLLFCKNPLRMALFYFIRAHLPKRFAFTGIFGVSSLMKVAEFRHVFVCTRKVILIRYF